MTDNVIEFRPKAPKDEEEPHCISIGRSYYGPYPWNFTYENVADPNDEVFPTPESWLAHHPNTPEAELNRLKDEYPGYRMNDY